LKKFKFFTKMMETSHLKVLNPISAFKIKYANSEKKTLELDSNEFNSTLKIQPLAEYDDSKVSLKDLNESLLTIPYSRLETLSIEFLMKQKPSNVSPAKLTNFVQSVFKEYKFVPYHNFAHGISVMQFYDSFISSLPSSTALFDNVHIFVGLIAALSHDIGHSGKNNAYNCTKKTKLAIKSLNKAVMEKFHIKKTLYLLRQPENNIFSEFNEIETSRSNELIIEAILATDMADHFNLVEKFNKTKLNDFKKNDNFLTGFVIHAGDLGNLCMQFDHYASWAKLITQEFQSQTESEKRYQLKESEFMKFKGKESFVKDQLFFASYLIRHLCFAVVQVNRRKV